ncbi:MAG: ligand-binding sensor domain-containing protein [Chitinophagaceae bacterium]
MKYFLCLYLLLPVFSLAQNTIALPYIVNYTKTDYNGGLQNWDIAQSENGLIFIANNEGLLTFDGKFWKLFPLPNKTIVRSVEISNDNKIFVGGQDEIGFFQANSSGQLVYYSLKEKLKESDRSFGDVWDIVKYKNSIFFRTNNKIFKWEDGKFTAYKAPNEWGYIGFIENVLVAQDFTEGILYYENNEWKPYVQVSTVFQSPITAIISTPINETLIVTLKAGIYSIKGKTIAPLKTGLFATIGNERIFKAITMPNNLIAFATSNAGIFITDYSGKFVQRFSTAVQLQNNNILSIYNDNMGNLWLGLNNGIDFVAFNSAVKHLSADLSNASGYTALVKEGNFYAGTSSGIFKAPLQNMADLSFSQSSFQYIPGTNGQVWNIAEINNKILVGHHEGAFELQNSTINTINTDPGFWNFIPFSSVYPVKQMASGGYKGIHLFQYQNNQFVYSGKIPGFQESSRFVAIDDQENIWVSHPYHGISKLVKQANNSYKPVYYNQSNGLPSTLDNHVFKIKGEVVFATQKGIYQFNNKTNQFTPHQVYTQIIGNLSIRYLKEDTEGNVWFVHEKSLGVIDFSDKKPVIVYISELNNKLLSGFEMIYPYNINNVFVAAERGFFHINYAKYRVNKPKLKVNISEVHINNKQDSLLYAGYLSDSLIQVAKPAIQSYWQTILLKFAAPLYGLQQNLEFSYRLKGFTDNWSEWTTKTEKEYTNLPAGKYVFEVKVRNNLGNESVPALYSFEILPPWYQTMWALFIYCLIVIVAITFVVKWQREKFNKQQKQYHEEQQRLQYLHQLEINKAESELMKLRNEKLQAEIEFKNAELANSAMHLVQKGEYLTKLKADLAHIAKQLNNEKAAGEIKKLIKQLGEADNMDKDWEQFTQHFDKVHSDFVLKLKEKHPNITSNDVKLCAYLYMNLSSKEIAQLLNISVRGVEISRYRLRKKLGIDTDTNLYDYLTAIQ